MEIRDYLRAIRRLLWLPLALPLLAGGVTGVVLVRQPSQYQADATVIVPAVSARGFSTSAAAQYVATFKDVLISQPVVQKVSAQTGVPTKDLVAGLSATTITASSNIIHVTFTGHNKANITTVVRDATVQTLDVVAEPQQAQAQNALTAATNALAKAESDITQFTADTGAVLPDQNFKTKEQELSQLLLQLQQAKLAGDTQRANGLQAIITDRQKELATLAVQAAQYTTLTDAKQSAMTVRDHAAQQVADSQALLTANHYPNTVTVTDMGKVSKVPEVLKFSAIAAAVALILSLAYILLLELIRARRPTRVASEEGEILTLPASMRESAADAALSGHAAGHGNSGGGANGHHLADSGAPVEPTAQPRR